jgi:ribosomal protein S17E
MTAFVKRMLKFLIRLSENYQMKIKSDWETHKGIACVQ